MNRPATDKAPAQCQLCGTLDRLTVHVPEAWTPSQWEPGHLNAKPIDLCRLCAARVALATAEALPEIADRAQMLARGILRHVCSDLTDSPP